MGTTGKSEEEDEPKPGIGRRLFAFAWRWTRRAVAVVLGVLLLLVGLYLTRGSTLHPLLVHYAPRVSRALSPFEVQVDAIEGDWRRRLVLRGVRIQATASAGALRAATAEEVSIEGSLVRLAMTADLSALRSVVARAPHAVIDGTESGPENESGGGTGAPTVLPALEIERGSLRWLTAGDVIDVEDVTARCRGGASAPIAVSAAAHANAWSARVAGSVMLDPSGEVPFNVEMLEGHVQDLDLTLTGVEGALRDGGAAIDAGVLRVGANEVSVSSLTIVPEDDGPPSIGGVVTFDVPRLDEVGAAILAATGATVDAPDAPEPTYFGSARGTIALTPKPGRIATGTIVISGEDIVLAGLRLGTVEARLLADDERVVALELRANDPGRVFVDGIGAYTFSSHSLGQVRLSFRFDQPEVYAPGLGFLRDVDAQIDLDGPLEAPDGRLRLRAARIESGERSIGELRVDGTLTAGVLDVSEAAAETEFGAIVTSARVGLPLGGRALDVLVRELALVRDGARLDLAEPVPITIDGADLRVDGLRLAGSGGELELDINTATDVGVRVVGEARALQLAPFLRDILGDAPDLGDLDGSISFQSDPVRGNVDVTLKDARLDDGGDEITARVDASWEAGRIEVRELRSSFENLSVTVQGSAPLALSADPFDDGAVALDATIRLDARGLRSGTLSAFVPKHLRDMVQRIDGTTDFSIDLLGTWAGLRGRGELQVSDVTYRDADGEFPPWLPGALFGALAVTIDEGLALDTSTLRAGDVLSVEASGRIDRALDLVSLVEDPSAWLDASLTAQANFVCDDLSWLAEFSQELREATGHLEVIGEAAGTLGSPEPSVSVVLEDGSLRYRGAPAVEDINLAVEVSSERAELESATFTLGAAPVAVTGGAVLGDGGPRLDFVLKGEEVLLYRSPDARIRADLNLSLRGRTDALALGGEVALVGGRIRSPVELQGILTSAGESAPGAIRRGIRLPAMGPSSLALDVKVTTVDPMRLEGRLVRGEVRADLTLTGDAANPIPSGRLFLDPLEVAVPAGVVRFPTGLMQFDPNQPEIPQLELIGSTRLAGYDITVSVEGDFDQAKVEFSSSPPIPPDDLILLVLTGRPPSSGTGAAAAGQAVALFVAKDLVQGWFSSGGFDDGDRDSFIDRVEVLPGQDVSRSGILTVRATYLVREGFARERDALYLVMERDSYEDYNFGLRLVLRLE